MKRLLEILALIIILFGVAERSSAEGPVYELEGVMENWVYAFLGEYDEGAVTVPPIGELTFVDGFAPLPGGTFTGADVESFILWNSARDFQIQWYSASSDTMTGTFSAADFTNGLPDIDITTWIRGVGSVVSLNPDDTYTADPNPADTPLVLSAARMYAESGFAPPLFDGTGIQITDSSSNIMTNVQVGDTVVFTVNAIAAPGAGTVNYRFFTRAGYGEADWGGNSWTLIQNFSTMNSVSVQFNEAGIYFLACHAERAGEAWAFGDPQTGIVVEVWPVQ